MDSIKFFKVTSLPAVLEPNSVYFINTAGILTVHISNNTGSSTVQLSGGNTGGGLIPYPVRKENPKVVGDLNASALVTQAIVTRRLYIIPFVTPRELTLLGSIINVTGSPGGNALIGIYDNIKLANGSDNPHQLLVSTPISTSAPTGNKFGNIFFKFEPNVLYWIGFMCSAAPTLRAVNAASVASSLGRITGNTAGVTHLFRNYTTFGLPVLGPTDLISWTTNIPAIYLVE